jgi:hypothetical protein
MIPGFKGFAAPEFLHQGWSNDGHTKKEKEKVSDFTFGGV